MNKIGEIQLNEQIKILDSFDFPEQFSKINISNIQKGTWIVFNETNEDEMNGTIVSKFFIVEKKYFQNNPNYDSYLWKTQENVISIEKGIIGIYNHNFIASENYINEMDDNVSNNEQAGVSNDYIACKTPFCNDGYFNFDTVIENNKVVALNINFLET